MTGVNYFISIRQLLQAEKTLRFRALSKYPKVPITELSGIFESTIELECEGDLDLVFNIFNTEIGLTNEDNDDLNFFEELRFNKKVVQRFICY
uniref:Uncharacterized protein n=1 Tax=Lepeophtheirus salmonis TaxID=72036 RepID=A0A0K2T0K1_LEPSM